MASALVIRTYVIKARASFGVANLPAQPIGTILELTGRGIPDDTYLLCDGRQYMNRCYPNLAVVLSGEYGGTRLPSRRWRWIGLYRFQMRRWLRSGVFNTPDLRNRVMLGVDFGGPIPS